MGVACGPATSDDRRWAQVLARAGVLLRRDPFPASASRSASSGSMRRILARWRPLRLGVLDRPVGTDRGDRLLVHGHLHRTPGRGPGGWPPDRREPGGAAGSCCRWPVQRHQQLGGPTHRRITTRRCTTPGWYGWILTVAWRWSAASSSPVGNRSCCCTRSIQVIAAALCRPARGGCSYTADVRADRRGLKAQIWREPPGPAGGDLMRWRQVVGLGGAT